MESTWPGSLISLPFPDLNLNRTSKFELGGQRLFPNWKIRSNLKIKVWMIWAIQGVRVYIISRWNFQYHDFGLVRTSFICWCRKNAKNVIRHTSSNNMTEKLSLVYLRILWKRVGECFSMARFQARKKCHESSHCVEKYLVWLPRLNQIRSDFRVLIFLCFLPRLGST